MQSLHYRSVDGICVMNYVIRRYFDSDVTTAFYSKVTRQWYTRIIREKIKMFTVVTLEKKKKLIVPAEWIKIVDDNFAIIFYSKDKNAIPCFENIFKHFHDKENRSYYGYVLKDKFG